MLFLDLLYENDYIHILEFSITIIGISLGIWLIGFSIMFLEKNETKTIVKSLFRLI